MESLIAEEGDVERGLGADGSLMSSADLDAVESQEDSAVHVCSKCSASFSLLSDLETHFCSEESSATEPQPSLTVPAPTVYTCKTCGKKFVNRYSFSAHANIHSKRRLSQKRAKTDGKSKPKTSLPASGKSTGKGKSSLSPQHASTMSLRKTGGGTPASQRTPLQVGSAFPCTYCGRPFSCRETQAEHMRLHTGEVPAHRCPCGMVYSCRSGLYRHRKICRVNPLPSVPVQSDGQSTLKASPATKPPSPSANKALVQKKPFKPAIKITNRMKSVLSKDQKDGTGRRVYRCKVCGQKFLSFVDMRTHLRSKHASRFTHRCPTCKMSYENSTSLLRHMTAHSTDGTGAVQCNECAADFNTLSSYSQHMKTIHGVLRPYKCNLCDMTFLRSRTLLSHKANNHGVDVSGPTLALVQPALESTAAPTEAAAPTPSKKQAVSDIPCDVCGLTFPTDQQVANHQRCHFLGDLPQCHLCCATFVCKPHLARHLWNHSGENGQSGA